MQYGKLSSENCLEADFEKEDFGKNLISIFKDASNTY